MESEAAMFRKEVWMVITSYLKFFVFMLLVGFVAAFFGHG